MTVRSDSADIASGDNHDINRLYSVTETMQVVVVGLGMVGIDSV